jgi:hypothetical protein
MAMTTMMTTAAMTTMTAVAMTIIRRKGGCQ